MIDQDLRDWIEPRDVHWQALAAEALAALISDLSEEGWCAGWEHGVEREAWYVANGERSHIGRHEVEPSERDALLALHKMLDGWVTWDSERGRRFVTTAEWLKILKEE